MPVYFEYFPSTTFEINKILSYFMGFTHASHDFSVAKIMCCCFIVANGGHIGGTTGGQFSGVTKRMEKLRHLINNQ